MLKPQRKRAGEQRLLNIQPQRTRIRNSVLFRNSGSGVTESQSDSFSRGSPGILFIYFQIGGSNTDTTASVVELVQPELTPSDQLDPEEVVNRFLDKETSMEERMALLRLPYDPVEVRKQLESIEGEWMSGVDSISPLGQAQMLDIGYHGFYVYFHNGAERYVCTVEQPDGFRVDWSAYSRTDAKTAWPRFLKGELLTAEMQVSVVPGNYYNYAFSDKQSYSSFVLRSPDCDAVIFGYARRHSVTEKIILQAVSEALGSGGLHPVLMKLRLESIDQSHQNRQFLVSHVVVMSWRPPGSPAPSEPSRNCGWIRDSTCTCPQMRWRSLREPSMHR
jgi:hypothetical protein